MKKAVLLLFISLSSIALSQEFNRYKYVLVPRQFSFQNFEDQYRLNTLVRHKLKQQGFTVLFDNEIIPNDLAKNSCLAIRADIVVKKSLFGTKTKLVLKNCKNQIIYQSPIASSKDKEYKAAYTKTINENLKSIKSIKYQYTSNNQPIEDKSKQEISTTTADTTAYISPSKPVITNVDNGFDISKKLYAQPIKNGFQLVDDTPRIVMKIYNTAKTDVFLTNDACSIVYKKDGKWFIAKTLIDEVVSNEINILFAR